MPWRDDFEHQLAASRHSATTGMEVDDAEGHDLSSAPRAQRPQRRRRKDARRYGFACANCKARKVKCSGEQPVCSACHRSGATCSWQMGSSATELLRASEQISHLQHALQRANEDLQARPPGSAGMSHNDVGPSPATSNQSSATTNGPLAQGSALWFQVGRGDDGSVVYNGPSSRFHVEALDDDTAQQQVSQEHTPGPPAERNAAQAEALAFQHNVLGNVWASMIPTNPRFQHLGFDSKTCMTLLDIYWTWLQPLHNVVYQPSEPYKTEIFCNSTNLSQASLWICLWGVGTIPTFCCFASCRWPQGTFQNTTEYWTVYRVETNSLIKPRKCSSMN